LLAACGSDHSASRTDAGGGGGGGGQTDAPADSPDDGLQTVTFSYTPGWEGVVSVDVIGGFGQSNDWTSPLVSLTQAGSTFSGTYQLPAGQYLYLFHVTGDSAAGNQAATYDRYALDPTQSAFVVCPPDSPTYGKDPNPCSQLTVPVGGSPTLYNITGRVLVSGTPTGGFLVVLERNEPSSHHFFVNRTTSADDGTYTVPAAAGTYHVQIEHPQLESKNDSQLDPAKLGIARKDTSDAFALSGDQTIGDVDMAFDYSAFAPTTGTPTLPTTFTFGSGSKTTLEIYGPGNEIADPWYNGTSTTGGTSSFDGTFNTPKAQTPMVLVGTQYMWGIEAAQTISHLKFTVQSLVYPITWGASGGD
jgi:hypothetical protein